MWKHSSIEIPVQLPCVQSTANVFANAVRMRWKKVKQNINNNNNNNDILINHKARSAN